MEMTPKSVRIGAKKGLGRVAYHGLNDAQRGLARKIYFFVRKRPLNQLVEGALKYDTKGILNKIKCFFDDTREARFAGYRKAEFEKRINEKPNAEYEEEIKQVKWFDYAEVKHIIQKVNHPLESQNSEFYV